MQRDCPTTLSFDSIMHVNEKGGRFGGTEEYIDSVTQHLAGLGVRSHLLCGVVAGELPAELDSTHLVPDLASRRLMPATAGEVAKVVARIDPDVVYLHNIFDARIIDALDQPGRRARLVWYVHDHYLTCLTELRIRLGHACSALLGRGCLDALGRGECTRRLPDLTLGPDELAEHQALLSACHRVDAVVVVSPYMRQLLLAHLPGVAARTHLLPRPVRPGSPRRALVSGGGGPVTVTFAGRITPEKGLHVVLEALAELPADLTVELQIAGVVEHREYWERCLQLAGAATSTNPAVTVRYRGHLAYDEIDDLFASSDIVVIPSSWPEPLGAVAAEASRAGAAVIASRVGGLGTFVTEGQTGLLVEPGDVAGWTAALVALARAPTRAHRMGAAGAVAVARLTAQAHLAAFDDVVRRLRPRL